MEKTKEQLKAEGMVLVREQKYGEAIAVFESLLNQEAQNTYYLDVLGFLCYMTADFSRAKGFCEASLEIKPDNHYAYKGLGLCLVRLGDSQTGIEMIKKSIALNPAYFDSHYDLGVTYLELGEYDQAEQCFAEAGRVDPARKADVEQALRHLASLKG